MAEPQPSERWSNAVIDLEMLRVMHPELPEELATIMISRAALALARNNHEQSVKLKIHFDKAERSAQLIWPIHDFAARVFHDEKRITEDGAEAIALAVVHREKNWTIYRRLQQGECGDWLLTESNSGDDGVKTIAFETSGVDKGKIAARLKAKIEQVSDADADIRCAGVVGFEQPEAAIHTLKETE
jgi:hypothetical protein